MTARRSFLIVVLAAVAFSAMALAPSQSHAAPRLSACADNIDNDRDGRTDFPSDAGCANHVADNDEVDPAVIPECLDGIENDADERLDFPDDPGCQSAADPKETNPGVAVECWDGVDNDGDSKTDFPTDKGCVAAADPSERDVACSNGLDDDGDGRFDFPTDLGCGVIRNDGRGPDQIDNDETDPPACNDGRDNDNDGKLDTDTTVPGQSPDPGCVSPVDIDEADAAPGVGTVPAGVDPVRGVPIVPMGKTAVTLKVWAAKPRKGKVRFVFTGTVANAPLEARVAIKVRELQWKNTAVPRIKAGRFRAAQRWRRSGRRWCFRAVALRHSLAPYKTGTSKTVCRRAR